MRGVDVSSNNGSVDWNAVKNAGYGDFAILRLGYGSDYANQDDAQFGRNVQKCEELGIPYGVYLYSYALNVEQAKSEANHALRQLKKVGSHFKYGVWFDMEDADNYKRKHGMPSNNVLVDICYTFCEIVEKAGYYTGIYASKSWLTGQLNNSRLDRFDKWVAQWSNSCTYNKSYSIWQYTSSAMIGGRRFDANQLIKDFAHGGTTPKPSTGKKSNDEIAQEVINGLWGNGDDRKKRLTAAGYDASAIQQLVNQKLNPKPSKKSNDEIAQEVINGKWGNGNDRKNRLKAAGYDPDIIQKIVNQKLGVSKPAKKSNDQIANEVIKGLWGNGETRKNKLRQAGYDPAVIQKLVNQKLK